MSSLKQAAAVSASLDSLAGTRDCFRNFGAVLLGSCIIDNPTLHKFVKGNIKTRLIANPSPLSAPRQI